MSRGADGKFIKGYTGNARGRPRSSLSARARDRIAGHLDELVDVLLERARQGDVAAARTLLERVAPALRAEELPVRVELPEGADLASTGRTVLAHAVAGALAPTQATALLAGLGTLARVIEVDEVVRRLAKLEEQLDASGKP
jgi:hypothetical protein